MKYEPFPKKKPHFGVLIVLQDFPKIFREPPWDRFLSKKKKIYIPRKRSYICDFRISYFIPTITMALNSSDIGPFPSQIDDDGQLIHC